MTQAHLVQLDIAWEDREKNLETVDRLVQQTRVEPGDLILLPELFDSGFSLNVDRNHDDDGKTLGFLLGLADRTGAFVQGARTRLARDGRALNSATVIDPATPRILREYDKIHPFSYGREQERFDGGNDVVTCTIGIDNTVVCPAICYDLRFPELFRIGLSAGAEVFTLGANWPAARQHHWRALCIARAIENQALFLAVNRCGNDPHLDYAGGTIAVGPQGDVLGELDDRQAVLSVDLDVSTVRQWRAQFPAWKDGRLINWQKPHP